MPSLVTLALSILITLAALALIAAWLLAGMMVRRRHPDPPCPPDTFDLSFEHVTFPARDGVMLGGWLTGERGRRPTVIFCAGMFGSMDGDTHLVPPFVETGFDVLQFDWRAHGVSDGRRGTLGVCEVLDAQGALDFLQARGVTRIGLMGFSFGGAVALRTAALDRRALCVACDGGFVSLQHALEGYLQEKVGAKGLSPLRRAFVWLALRLAEVRLGLRVGEAEPIHSVGAISPRPALFIHGQQDPLVPIADQDALLAVCGEPKTLWRVEGAGHRQAHERAPEEYRQRVIGFFRQHLRV